MRLRIWIAVFLLIACAIAFILLRPLTQNQKVSRIYLREDQSLDKLIELLESNNILSDGFWLNNSARLIGLKKIKAGSYVVQPEENLVQLLRKFHGHHQTPVKLVIGNERVRIRTSAQFASKMQRHNYTRADSTEWMIFLSSDDSLQSLGLNHHNVLTRMMPFTYEIYWTESPRQILHQLENSWNKYWDADKREKAQKKGLSPTEVSILASIVEEETQYAPDRTLIASTYLNRLRIGMRLQADPTAKFASGDLQAKRVTFAHLQTQSPYNTYLVGGLPPGPICLPSLAAIEAVLNAPQTDYLYFVASHRFDGTSVFSKDYNQHLQYAKLYQQELTRRTKK